jgi:hypothetical protein
LFSWLEGTFGPYQSLPSFEHTEELEALGMLESLVATVNEQRQFGACLSDRRDT